MQFDIPTFTPSATESFFAVFGGSLLGVVALIAVVYLFLWFKKGAFKKDLHELGDAVGITGFFIVIATLVIGTFGGLYANAADERRYEATVAKEIVQDKDVTIIDSGTLGFSHGITVGLSINVIENFINSLFEFEDTNSQYEVRNNSLNQGVVIMDNSTGATVKCQTYAHDGEFIFSCNNDQSDQLVSLDTALQTANSGINISK